MAENCGSAGAGSREFCEYRSLGRRVGAKRLSNVLSRGGSARSPARRASGTEGLLPWQPGQDQRRGGARRGEEAECLRSGRPHPATRTRTHTAHTRTHTPSPTILTHPPTHPTRPRCRADGLVAAADAFKAGDFARALRLWEAALATAAEAARPALHSNRGAALERLGLLPEAVAAYDVALALRPAHVDALHNRACALRALGRPELALAGFRAAQAASARGDFFPSLRGACACLISLQRFDEAAVAARAAAAQRAADPGPLADLAFSLLKLSGVSAGGGGVGIGAGSGGGGDGDIVSRERDRLGEAVECFRRARALGDNSAETARLHGVALSHLAVQLDVHGEAERAEECYEAAIALQATETRLFNLACLLMRTGRAAAAAEGFARVEALNPLHAQARAARGTLLLQFGRLEEGLAELLEARALVDVLKCEHKATPDVAELMYNVGFAALGLGRFSEAECAFREALAKDPALVAAAAGVEAARDAAEQQRVVNQRQLAPALLLLTAQAPPAALSPPLPLPPPPLPAAYGSSPGLLAGMSLAALSQPGILPPMTGRMLVAAADIDQRPSVTARSETPPPPPPPQQQQQQQQHEQEQRRQQQQQQQQQHEQEQRRQQQFAPSQQQQQHPASVPRSEGAVRRSVLVGQPPTPSLSPAPSPMHSPQARAAASMLAETTASCGDARADTGCENADLRPGGGDAEGDEGDERDEESPSARFRSGVLDGKLDGFDGLVLPARTLRGPGGCPDGLDCGSARRWWKLREAYLEASEFRSIFGMDKPSFYALAKWKRIELKRHCDLF